MDAIGTQILGFATEVTTAAPAVIGGGLAIFGVIYGVRKLKGVLKAAS